MREIEFRVWNTKEKKYFKHFKGCRVDLALRYYETHRHVAYPEQYTGLKDKNDKKIFEGDIVTITETQENVTTCGQVLCVSVVKFINGSFCYSRAVIRRRDSWSVMGTQIPIQESIEIIGTIHDKAE